MTRQLNTGSQRIARHIDSSRVDKTRRAWLVTPYKDFVQNVLVQFTDPRLGSRGTVAKARVSAGIAAAPSLEEGTAVTVRVRRGQLEVVGL